MAMKRDSRGTAAVFAKQLIAGTEKQLVNKTQVEFMGSSFTPAQITSNLLMLVDLRASVNATRATAKAKLADETTQIPPLHAFMSAYVAFLRVAFGSSPEALADFGITPKTRAPLTVEAKAAAVAKNAATLAARHTMGPKQKKGIKGTVTGVVVTPITASPSVTAPSSPAAPATSGSNQASGAATPARTA